MNTTGDILYCILQPVLPGLGAGLFTGAAERRGLLERVNSLPNLDPISLSVIFVVVEELILNRGPI